MYNCCYMLITYAVRCRISLNIYTYRTCTRTCRPSMKLVGLMNWKIASLLHEAQSFVIVAKFSLVFHSCFPSGSLNTTIQFDVRPGGKYDVQATATAGNETDQTEIFTITIPTINSCSVHLINNGTTVEGGNAIIQFVGINTNSFKCELCGDRDSETCAFTAA